MPNHQPLPVHKLACEILVALGLPIKDCKGFVLRFYVDEVPTITAEYNTDPENQDVVKVLEKNDLCDKTDLGDGFRRYEIRPRDDFEDITSTANSG